MSRRNLRLALPLIALTSFLVGCSSFGSRKVPVEGTLTGSPIAVEVHNPAGSVSIVADDSLDRPVIRARLDADGPLPRPLRNAARDRAEITARIRSDAGRDVLDIDVTAADPAEVRLSIRLPRSKGVAVTAARREVYLRGVQAPISVQTEKADIDLRLEQLPHGPITLSTADGDINVLLPAKTAALFRLASPRGRTTMRASGTVFTNVRSTPSSFTGVSNSGSDMIEAAADEGDVEVMLR